MVFDGPPNVVFVMIVERRRIPLSRNSACKSFVFGRRCSLLLWRWPAGQLWILLRGGGVDAT